MIGNQSEQRRHQCDTNISTCHLYADQRLGIVRAEVLRCRMNDTRINRRTSKTDYDETDQGAGLTCRKQDQQNSDSYREKAHADHLMILQPHGDKAVDETAQSDAEIEQGGKNLSGGQRQRLTIARALVKKPEILILDDSASALDFATDAALRKSLRELDYHPTVFIVSQRTSSIQHADRIIVLDDGAAVGIGTHDELMKSCSVYQEIYNSQFKKEAV